MKKTKTKTPKAAAKTRAAAKKTAPELPTYTCDTVYSALEKMKALPPNTYTHTNLAHGNTTEPQELAERLRCMGMHKEVFTVKRTDPKVDRGCYFLCGSLDKFYVVFFKFDKPAPYLMPLGISPYGFTVAQRIAKAVADDLNDVRGDCLASFLEITGPKKKPDLRFRVIEIRYDYSTPLEQRINEAVPEGWTVAGVLSNATGYLVPPNPLDWPNGAEIRHRSFMDTTLLIKRLS